MTSSNYSRVECVFYNFRPVEGNLLSGKSFLAEVGLQPSCQSNQTSCIILQFVINNVLLKSVIAIKDVFVTKEQAFLL